MLQTIQVRRTVITIGRVDQITEHSFPVAENLHSLEEALERIERHAKGRSSSHDSFVVYEDGIPRFMALGDGRH